MDTNPRLFDVERQDGTLILTPLRNLGEFAMQDLHQEVEELLESCERDQIQHVLIDFVKTDYLESTALNFLLSLRQSVIGRQGKMAFCHLSDHEREVLEDTHLERLWTVYDSRDAALAALNSGG